MISDLPFMRKSAICSTYTPSIDNERSAFNDGATHVTLAYVVFLERQLNNAAVKNNQFFPIHLIL